MKMIFKTILMCSIAVAAVSCKKDGPAPEPEEEQPRTVEEFLDLSYDEQMKYSEEYLSRFLNKQYRFYDRQVSEVDENGLPTGQFSKSHQPESSTVCEKMYVINTPAGLGLNNYVTVSIDEQWANENGCPIVEFPYRKSFNLQANTDSGLPISVVFPDVKAWSSEQKDESGFYVLPFPFLDTFNSSITLLKFDGEHWQMYGFGEI